MNPVRRFAAALREMRWSHVVIELALLVIGILIALAVDGWVDDRRDARIERQYLELLSRELDRDLKALDEVLDFEEAQVAASVLAYRALRGGVAPEDREAVAVALRQLTVRRTLRLGRATYADLLSTGNLRLIRNVELRDRIVRLYEANERAEMIRDRNNQEFVDRMYMTYLLDEGLVAPRPFRNLPALAAYEGRFAARVGMTADASLDRLWRLPPDASQWSILIGRVWERGLVSQGAIYQSEQTIREIEAVRTAISNELSTRRWP